MRNTLRLALACALGACAPVRGDPTATPNTDFDIPVRSSVLIEGTGVRIRFDTVTEDSRCPSNAVCVWAGNATVRLTLDSSPPRRTVDLKTTPPTPADAFGVHIELRGLRPHPEAGKTTRFQDYVATLRVTR